MHHEDDGHGDPVSVGLRDEPYAPSIARVLEERAEREMSRGMLSWDIEENTERRGGAARRRFEVTETGTEALAKSRRVLLTLWDGVEDLLGDLDEESAVLAKEQGIGLARRWYRRQALRVLGSYALPRLLGLVPRTHRGTRHE
jgi:hypothetical protein